MKIIIASDSYKGSLSAVEVANAAEMGIRRVHKNAEVIKLPVADGGEGTVEALVEAVGGEIRKIKVTGPLGNQIESFYGLIDGGKTAVIEMAAASGLPLVPVDKRNPLETTSYGTGELIKNAIQDGCRKMIIGIGGSATNDGGMGMAQALGVKFLDIEGNELGFGGKQLEKIKSIDRSSFPKALKDIKVVVACDVKNPLCGENGASRVYGPQKGATPDMVARLDQGLKNYAERIREFLGTDIEDIPGSGAAGGLGGGLCAFLGAELKPGIEIVTEAVELDKKMMGADLVITGEGRTDFQTAFGKTPVGVSRIAKKYSVPVVCVSGGLGDNLEGLYEEGITALFSIADRPMTLEEALKDAAQLVERTVENITRLYFK